MRWHPHLNWCRLVCVLGFSLAGLQVFHFILLNRLETRKVELKQTETVQYLGKELEEVYTVIKNSVYSSPIVDSSGQYRIVYDVLQSDSFVSGEDESAQVHRKYGVTLATQCSINHIHRLLQLSQKWHSPISVAVFVPMRYSSLIVRSILSLHYCIPHIKQRISLHLVYALTQDALDLTPKPVINQIINCNDFQEGLETDIQELKENYKFNHEKFPNNLLRNVAQRKIQSDYVMMIDIDMVPSANLYQNFIDFARRGSFTSDTASLDIKTVYTVLAFEIQNGIPVPSDKKSLTELWNRGHVRPFYYEPCAQCQGLADYNMWKNLTAFKGLSIAYEVTWRHPWEPFYIGHSASLPLFDERFKQYGFNRVSQSCELNVAGYKFVVLNNAFLVHLGFKNLETFHNTKDLEHEQNRALYKQFKDELKTKYPDSVHTCS